LKNRYNALKKMLENPPKLVEKCPECPVASTATNYGKRI